MKKRRFVRFCVSLLAAGLILAGCDTGSLPDNAEPLVLTGNSNGKALTITISQTDLSKAVLNPKGGEYYEIRLANELISKGKLKVIGGSWTFMPSSDSPGTKSQFSAIYGNSRLSNLTVPGTAINNAQASINGNPSGNDNNGNNDDGNNNNGAKLPALTGSITINNTEPKVGNRLTAEYDGNGTGDFTWEWFRGNTVIRRTTTTADTSVYTVVAADANETLMVRVSTDEQSGSITSAPTEEVVDNRPALTGTMSLSNLTPKVGDTITASYTDGNGSGAASWQWLRGDDLISGAVSDTYTAVLADVGRTLMAQVSYTGQNGRVTSAATAAVVNSQSLPQEPGQLPQEPGQPPQEPGQSPVQETVDTPSASLAEGIYTSAQSVTLSTTTSGATIYYTVNGSAPTTSSTQYTGAITINTSITLKAFAVKTGMNDSGVLTANYYVYDGSVLPLGDGMYVRDVDIDGGVVVEMRGDPKQITNYFMTTQVAQITEKLYTVFADDFDSIILVMDNDEDYVEELGYLYGINYRVSNAVNGIGISGYSNSAAWGSDGKLKSVMAFTYRGGIGGGPGLHEFAHNWAAFIVPENDSYDGHWGVSNAGGQLGGFKYGRVVEENCDDTPGKTRYQGSMYEDKNEDGSFMYPGFGEVANGGNGVPYSDIELYLMGMKSASELPDDFSLDFYTDISVDDSCYDDYGRFNGCFYATGVTSYTIDQLIALNGPRDPDAASSQKHFKVLTVFVSNDDSPDEYYQGVVNDIKWFANMPEYENRYPWSYNFNQATGGIGSLIVTDLRDSLK